MGREKLFETILDLFSCMISVLSLVLIKVISLVG